MTNPHVSTRWPARLERKIDIFINGDYFSSSNAYCTCKAAIAGVRHTLKMSPHDPIAVKAYYAERKKP